MTKVADIRDKTTKQPRMDDVASWETSVYSLNGRAAERYNPDLLVGRQGLQIFDRMRCDEQVKAVMQFKRDAITARGWSFVYDPGTSLSTEEQKRRINIFTQLLQKMKGGSFEDGLNIICTGRDYGYSVTEKVYTQVPIDGKEYVGLRMLLGCRPTTIRFITNDHGILERVDQEVNARRQTLDMRKFIHYVHAPEFDRYFGRSDLREAYKAWFIKQRIGDYWTLYLERFAGGFLKVTQTDQSSMVFGSPEYQSLQSVLVNLHGAAGVILPRGVDAEMVSPATTDAYEKAMVFWDLAIAKAILVPNLLGLSHTGQTGAFAQSQTQLRAFIWTCLSDSKRIQATIDDQLVFDLGEQNFGDGQYPSFRFNEMDFEFLQWLVTTWSTLTGKVVISTEADETHLRKLLGMPERKEDDRPVIDPVVEQQEARTTQESEFDQELRERQQTHTEKTAANEARFAALEDNIVRLTRLLEEREEHGGRLTSQSDHSGSATSNQPAAIPHGALRSCNRVQFDRAVQRVMFSVIERQQDEASQMLTNQVAGFVARTVSRLMGDEESMQLLIDDHVEDVAALEFTNVEVIRLQQIYREALGYGYSIGFTTARNELERARGEAFTNRASFASIRDRAAQYFEVNAFRLAGNVSDAVRSMIQNELMLSIKAGRSPAQTREAIWWRLVDKGMTTKSFVKQIETDEGVQRALDRLWVDTPEQAARYLDTLSRTNLFEAMNEARYAEFTDPDLDGFVEGLEYSAILDDRTTEICASLNNMIWSADNELWNEYRPPNHFNCRSVLIPITTIDGWDGVESPVPRVDPQVGFGTGT